ncbi:MAG TPA: hypothetical protein VHN98_04905 [Acidimicrobiales bacterium]|nr:hypothetical protein [Acidimicrobiales bacterium]
MTPTSRPPTLDSSQPPGKQRWARRARFVFVAALTAFLLAALGGVLGLRDRTVRASGGGYTLVVRYTAVSRSGLRGGFDVKVHGPAPPAPATDSVVLSVDSRYLDSLDLNRIVPQPSREWSRGDVVLFAFDRVPGADLQIDFDANVPPNEHHGQSGRIAVGDGERDDAAVHVRTTVFP